MKIVIFMWISPLKRRPKSISKAFQRRFEATPDVEGLEGMHRRHRMALDVAQRAIKDLKAKKLAI